MTRAQPPELDLSHASLQTLQRGYPRGTSIDTHSHDWAQVLYASSGVMWVEAQAEALVVPPQRAVWLPPQTPHAIRMLSDVQMRNLYLHPAQAALVSARAEVIEVADLLRELMLALIANTAERSDEHLQLLQRAVMLELKHAPRDQLRIPLPQGPDRRLLMLCHAVIAEPSQAISFEQHAEQAGASVRTLARLFQQELGLGFAQWRRQVQLAVAVSRLIEGQPVQRVATALGYRASSFSDMFKRELGASPAAYVSHKQA